MKQVTTQTIVIALIVRLAGFFGGMKYQQSKTEMPRGQFMLNREGQPGRNGGAPMIGETGRRPEGGMGTGTRPVSGEIIATDEASITIKMQDGSSKIVMISETTDINKAEKGTKTDLSNGQDMMVFGKENTDGTVTAINVQVNPSIESDDPQM